MRTSVRTGETSAEFDLAAPRYDLMVGLNPGYHDHLREAATRLAERLPERAVDLLDLGCGSGASTRAMLDVVPPGHIRSLLGIDASRGMLAQAEAKLWPDGVRFAAGQAEDVTDLVAAPVDGILAAYLFRNVARRDETVAAVHDVLVPGGTLVVQEYSVKGRLAAMLTWSVVCWLVVIPLAAITTRRTTLYRYLWRSVLRFDTVDEFTARLRRAGFTDIEVTTVGGWQRGILHTIRARRPA